MKIALVDNEQIYIDEMAKLCWEFGEGNRLETEISACSDGESFLRSGNEFSVVLGGIFL